MRCLPWLPFAVMVSTAVLADAMPLVPLTSSAGFEFRYPEPARPPLFQTPTGDHSRNAERAADPTQWLIGELTDEEQKLLELINRARANPVAESTRLQNLADPDIRGAYQFYGVDFSVFAADMAMRPVVPPLTPYPQLIAAARGHSQYQLSNAVQSHDEKDPITGVIINGSGDRVTAAGYLWTNVRESVYSFAQNMDYAHAGFEVDWGPGAGGQQSPPGHRESNHDGRVTEVGLGVLSGTNTIVHDGVPTTVGPRVVTIDFARPQNLRTYVTGVVYYDLNGNGEYDEGEGLPGVRVEVSGAAYYAQTTLTGGFAVPTGSGAKTVLFSATALANVSRAVTVVGGDSVKVDLALPYEAPLLVGPAVPVVGFANGYRPSEFPSATAYEWRATQRTVFSTVLGAEGGLDGFTAATTPGYTPRSTASHAAGAASYRLVNASGAHQILSQTAELVRTQTGATLSFSYRFGFSTGTEIAYVEVSTDDGATWGEIWSQAGLGEGAVPGGSYQSRSVALNVAPGKSFKTRFRYWAQPLGNLYVDTNDQRVGFFFDEVRYSGVAQVTPAGGGEIAAGAVIGFVPSAVGDYVLQTRPKVGVRIFPYGRSLAVTARVGTPPVDAVTRIGTSVIGPNGKMRVDFSALSGFANGFELERASKLGSGWLVDATATLTTNSPGNYSFKQINPSGDTGFLRIRAK